MPKIRRALLTVSDKSGIVDLARALAASGAELVATGRTAAVLEEAGLKITPIEKVSGSPEAFQGRMKTLSFPVCSGILYRRGDSSDEKDLKRLGIVPIDCVVVNFYPFEKTVAEGKRGQELIEQIDIGGPTLVRAAAKNAPDVLVLTGPDQYASVIAEIERGGVVTEETSRRCGAEAWDRIHAYDRAIAERLGARAVRGEAGPSAKESGQADAGTLRRELRYGENPHQSAYLEFDSDGPLAWNEALTPNELSYNNILDLSAAYALAGELAAVQSDATGVVIVKHNNPCGVAWVPRSTPEAQKVALIRAWEGDPVSAFGGVLVFSDPLTEESASWLSERFVELVSAPELNASTGPLQTLLAKRKKLKAVRIRRMGEEPAETTVHVPGGRLRQTTDRGLGEPLKGVTRKTFPSGRENLVRFGIAVCRALKSNAIALVREIPGVADAYQLVGAGQGQPNRIEALKALAVPRAQAVLRESGGKMADCVMVSDAFFPFRDTVDTAYSAGIRFIVQPGGSLKDSESIQACDEHGIAMVFTGTRHFRH